MKFETVCNKLRYYVHWYQSMNLEERQSGIGLWVRDRIQIFSDIIVEVERNIPRYYSGGGNYKSNFQPNNN
jgi:hypothetical protein